jgi:hypothetical protein
VEDTEARREDTEARREDTETRREDTATRNRIDSGKHLLKGQCHKIFDFGFFS